MMIMWPNLCKIMIILALPMGSVLSLSGSRSRGDICRELRHFRRAAAQKARVVGICKMLVLFETPAGYAIFKVITSDFSLFVPEFITCDRC